MIYLILMCVLGVLLVYENIVSYMNRKELIKLLEGSHKLLERGMDKWDTERQQLLDRIQAPSFAEYKTQEVRIIKAHNNEKEPPKLEQL